MPKPKQKDSTVLESCPYCKQLVASVALHLFQCPVIHEADDRPRVDGPQQDRHSPPSWVQEDSLLLTDVRAVLWDIAQVLPISRLLSEEDVRAGIVRLSTSGVLPRLHDVLNRLENIKPL